MGAGDERVGVRRVVLDTAQPGQHPGCGVTSQRWKVPQLPHLGMQVCPDVLLPRGLVADVQRAVVRQGEAHDGDATTTSVAVHSI